MPFEIMDLTDPLTEDDTAANLPQSPGRNKQLKQENEKEKRILGTAKGSGSSQVNQYLSPLEKSLPSFSDLNSNIHEPI